MRVLTNHFLFRDSFIPSIGDARPQVLILDSASCHLNLEAIELAKREDVALITLPGKSTAFLQPVDQVLSVLIQAFGEVAYGLSFTKAGFLVKPSNFPPVLEQAIDRAWRSRPDIIRESFRKTGIYYLLFNN